MSSEPTPLSKAVARLAEAQQLRKLSRNRSRAVHIVELVGREPGGVGLEGELR